MNIPNRQEKLKNKAVDPDVRKALEVMYVSGRVSRGYDSLIKSISDREVKRVNGWFREYMDTLGSAEK